MAPYRFGGAYFFLALITWIFLIGGYIIVIVGGVGVLGKLWYMRDNQGSSTSKSLRRDLIARLISRDWGCYTGGGTTCINGGTSSGGSSSSAYYTAGGPGQKFGYSLQANCLAGETDCDNPNSALTDSLGNGVLMSNLHSNLEYFLAFPVANIIIFGLGGLILLIYSYAKVQNWLKDGKAPDDKVTAARMYVIHRLRGICLGFSLIILLNITVETVLRFYYIQVRLYWLGASAPPLYNNALQIGIEWTIAVLSILWFTLVLLVLTETKRDGQGITTMGSWYRNVCFICIPCGLG